MNIFILSTNPIQAARAHCDQHLHKMILESAQMLSTAASSFLSHAMWDIHRASFYKPAYINHPCTIWASQYIEHAAWLVSMAEELEVIRAELEHPPHASSSIIKAFKDIVLVTETIPLPLDHFVFAGPALFSLRRDYSITKKYQEYYLFKAKHWAIDKAQRMRYKGRPIPDFLQDSIYVDS